MKKLFSDFIGGRILPPDFRTFLIANSKPIASILYRGMTYPKHLLKEGAVIEEWYGSTHWSFSEDVAKRFSKDYINEDYKEDLIEELGKGNVDFVSLVLTISGIEGVDMAPFLKEYDLFDDFSNEQEVTVIGKNFRIKSIERKDINGECFYFAKVLAEERK